MTEMVIDDFNWGDVPSYSESYLAGPLVDACQKIGASTILDLGCGNGLLTKHLADAGFQVTGCDTDKKGTEKATKFVPDARFIQCSVYDSPDVLEGKTFDAVISCEVIEHLYYPGKLLEFAAAALRPSGHLILTTPYHGYLKNLAIALAGGWDFHHSAWDGGHIKFWSKRSLTTLLNKEGFNVVGFRGLGRCVWLWKSMMLVSRLK